MQHLGDLQHLDDLQNLDDWNGMGDLCFSSVMANQYSLPTEQSFNFDQKLWEPVNEEMPVQIFEDSDQGVFSYLNAVIPDVTQTPKPNVNTLDLLDTSNLNNIEINTLDKFPVCSLANLTSEESTRCMSSSSSMTTQHSTIRQRKHIRKVKMYERQPFSDDEQERKRLNAIKAKNTRAKKNEEVMQLKEKISSLQQKLKERDESIEEKNKKIADLELAHLVRMEKIESLRIELLQ